MAEEAAAAPGEAQDTPQESAPQVEDTRDSEAPSTEDTASEAQEPSHDWEKRYSDLRPQFDRQAQELSEAQQYRQVVEALQSDDVQERAWAADILGLEFGDEEEGDTPGEEEEQYFDPRVDQLLQEREAQQHEAMLEDLEKRIDSQIDDLDKKHSLNLDDREKEMVFARALSLPPGEDGLPPVGQAVDEYRNLLDQRITRYRESKRDAPSPPAPGSSGANAPDLSDRKSRLAAANAVAQRALMREQ